MAKFEVGDVVRFKAGTVDMTVSDNGPIEVGGAVVGTAVIRGALRDDLVVCKWFAGKTVETKRFKTSELDLVRPAAPTDISEGQLVRLASGGPEMLVESCGPISVGGAVMASASRGVVKMGGTVRNDLASCKWQNGKKIEHKRFELATLITV